MTNSLDPHEQNRRSQYLHALAILDGRNDPSHPRHGTFTGLYMARIRQLIDRDMELLLDGTPPQIPVPPAWLVESWRQGWRPADDSLGGFGTYMARESAAWGYQQGITQTEAQAQTAGEIEGRRYPILHRWNFELRDDGLYACRHLHDKGQHCEYERLTEAMVRKGARFGGGEVE